jgi:hypothetical protein
LRNSKIFFDGLFLSIYSHLLKKLELSKLCRWGSKNPENGLFKKVSLSKKRHIFLFFFVSIKKTKWLIKKLHFISNDIKYFNLYQLDISEAFDQIYIQDHSPKIGTFDKP